MKGCLPRLLILLVVIGVVLAIPDAMAKTDANGQSFTPWSVFCFSFLACMFVLWLLLRRDSNSRPQEPPEPEPEPMPRTTIPPDVLEALQHRPGMAPGRFQAMKPYLPATAKPKRRFLHRR